MNIKFLKELNKLMNEKNTTFQIVEGKETGIIVTYHNKFDGSVDKCLAMEFGMRRTFTDVERSTKNHFTNWEMNFNVENKIFNTTFLNDLIKEYVELELETSDLKLDEIDGEYYATFGAIEGSGETPYLALKRLAHNMANDYEYVEVKN